MRTHPFLVVNPGSGGGKGLDKLLSAARARGIETVRLGGPVDPSADVLGVAGGDGSLGTVAATAIERDVPFVCIPFGTPTASRSHSMLRWSSSRFRAHSDS